MKIQYGDLFTTVVKFNKQATTMEMKKNLTSVLNMLSQEIEFSIKDDGKEKRGGREVIVT